MTIQVINLCWSEWVLSYYHIVFRHIIFENIGYSQFKVIIYVNISKSWSDHDGRKLSRVLQHFQTPPGASQGVPWLDRICNPSSKFRVCPGSPPGWMCLGHLQREESWRHPDQITKPPQQVPTSMKEQPTLSSSPDSYSWARSPYQGRNLILSVVTQSSWP